MAFSECLCFDFTFPFAHPVASLLIFPFLLFPLLFLLFLTTHRSPVSVELHSSFCEYSSSAIELVSSLYYKALFYQSSLSNMSGVVSTQQPSMEDLKLQDHSSHTQSAQNPGSPPYQLRSVKLSGKPIAMRVDGHDNNVKSSIPLRTPSIRPDHRFSPKSRTSTSSGTDGQPSSYRLPRPETKYVSQSVFYTNNLGTGSFRSAGFDRSTWSLNNRPLTGPSRGGYATGANSLLGGKSTTDMNLFRTTSSFVHFPLHSNLPRKSIPDAKPSRTTSSLTRISKNSTLPRKRSLEDDDSASAQRTIPQIDKAVVAKFRRMKPGSFARVASTAESDLPPGSPMDIDTPEHKDPQPNVHTSFGVIEPDSPISHKSCPMDDMEGTRDYPSSSSPYLMPGTWPGSVPPHDSFIVTAHAGSPNIVSMSGALMLPVNKQLTDVEDLMAIDPAIQEPPSPWNAYWTMWQYNFRRVFTTVPTGFTQTVSRVVRTAVTVVGDAKRRMCEVWRQRRLQPGHRQPSSPRGSPTRANLRSLSPEQQQRVRRDQRLRSRGNSPPPHFPFPDLSHIPDFPTKSSSATEHHKQSNELAIKEPRDSVTSKPRASASSKKNRASKRRDHPAQQEKSSKAPRSPTKQSRPKEAGPVGIRKRLPSPSKRAERAKRARENSLVWRALLSGDKEKIKKVGDELIASREREASGQSQQPNEPFILNTNNESNESTKLIQLANLKSRSPTAADQIETKKSIELNEHTTLKVPSPIAIDNEPKKYLKPKKILKSKDTNATTRADIEDDNELKSPRQTTDALPRSVPKKPKFKRNVRFREPVVAEYIDDTRDWSELEPDLAPHLNEALDLEETPTNKISAIETKPDQKENVPPTSGLDAINEPSLDPWSQPFEYPLGRPVSAVRLFYPVQQPIPDGRTESVYAARWKEIEEEQKKKELPARVKPDGPAVRPLSSEWEARIKNLENRSVPVARKVATTLSGDPLTKKDLATCYTRGEWLNDEIINSYLALIVDYLRRTNHNAGRHDKPRFHAFNSFFFSNLRDKGYESVARWAKRAKIGGPLLLDVDTVYIPVHNSQHWTLVVVRPGERSIEHFDSLGALSRRHVAVVKTWLRGELGPQYVEEEWRVLPSRSPQQDNGSDCGVFLLSTAKAVAIGLEPLSYGAADTPLLRRKIVAELMAGGLEGEFDPAQGGQVLL
ncbi:SUMO protease ULP1 [Aspergillus ibericus CBS 121593]|uniref:Ubiquitin-like protease family profile domain-containing protein n=1 Tax=Aspergillus ibericus CBS 121593 TaxID=1448316 RepID=A0A395GVN4_9EURO|nr:hypothetical protein BO80DRAFT_494846 [Aspergillus ibericus CBS 121593]RAK99566.1 hypothetical protein BO80DRAFT_494846 [Aspergillus ibericus CBS 121593]